MCIDSDICKAVGEGQVMAGFCSYESYHTSHALIYLSTYNSVI